MAEVAGRGLDALSGILDAMGEGDAAEHVDTMRDEIVAVVEAVERADPYAVANAIVDAVSEGLLVAGLVLPAGLLQITWPLVAKVMEPFYKVSLEGERIDGVADFT